MCAETSNRGRGLHQFHIQRKGNAVLTRVEEGPPSPPPVPQASHRRRRGRRRGGAPFLLSPTRTTISTAGGRAAGGGKRGGLVEPRMGNAMNSFKTTALIQPKFWNKRTPCNSRNPGCGHLPHGESDTIQTRVKHGPPLPPWCSGQASG